MYYSRARDGALYRRKVDTNTNQNSEIIKEKIFDIEKLVNSKLVANKILNNESNLCKNEEECDDSIQISEKLSSLSICKVNFKFDKTWDYGASGYTDEQRKLWIDPCRIFKVGNIEKLDNLFNNFKYLHPNNKANTYFARSGFIPSSEKLSTKDANGCSYICFNFNANRQRSLYMSPDLFHIIIKEIALFLVAQNYDEKERPIYESICCLESLCKINRSGVNRKNFTLKIWKLNNYDNLTVIEYILKIFTNLENVFLGSCHIKYFCETLNEIIALSKNFKEDYKNRIECYIQRSKFLKMSDLEIKEFQEACMTEEVSTKFSALVRNSLLRIKIQNFPNEN